MHEYFHNGIIRFAPLLFYLFLLAFCLLRDRRVRRRDLRSQWIQQINAGSIPTQIFCSVFVPIRTGLMCPCQSMKPTRTLSNAVHRCSGARAQVPATRAWLEHGGYEPHAQHLATYVFNRGHFCFGFYCCCYSFRHFTGVFCILHV